VLQLISISFKDENKWKFSDGNSQFFALIEDQSFLEEVKNRERLFGSNDFLKVEAEIKKYRTSKNELKSEYVIKKVIEHLKGGNQLKLPFESPPNQT